MKKNILIIGIVVIVGTVFLLNIINKDKNNEKVEKLGDQSATVFVSIAPLHYFVSSIAADSVNIEIVVPDGVEPETYAPTSRQLNDIANSDLFLTIGLPYEEKVTDTLENRFEYQYSMPIGNDIERLLDGDEWDPHIWMSLKNAYVIAADTLAVLIARFPHNSQVYSENYEALITDISEAETAIKNSLVAYEGSAFVVYHPVLGYLANEMGIVQESIQIRGRERSLKQIKELKDNIKKNKITILFIQEGFPDASARSLASDLGLTLFLVDPLRKDWLSNMIEISGILSDNFSKE